MMYINIHFSRVLTFNDIKFQLDEFCYDIYNNSRFISNISSFDCGGVRFVFDAWQISLELRCCRPILGKVRVFIVFPSDFCSNDSSIIVFSKYHIKDGFGSPENYINFSQIKQMYIFFDKFNIIFILKQQIY